MTYLDLSLCEFHPDRGQLSVRREDLPRDPTRCGFPREILVHSHHTGRELLFRPIGPGHRLFDEDYWDGEQQIYEHSDNLVKKVTTLVVYNGR